MHCFDEAVNPPWEARTDFEVFQTLAHLVGRLAANHLGTQTDVSRSRWVTTPRTP